MTRSRKSSKHQPFPLALSHDTKQRESLHNLNSLMILQNFRPFGAEGLVFKLKILSRNTQHLFFLSHKFQDFLSCTLDFDRRNQPLHFTMNRIHSNSKGTRVGKY